MKKTAILIAAAMCSCSAFAVNGPYVGVGLGYSNSIFQVDAAVTADIENIPIAGDLIRQRQKSFQGTASGIQGQLVAGYTYDINKFNLAAELTAQLPRTTYADINASDDSRYYKFYYTYGVNLVPGYHITKRSLIYLKIGASRGKFASNDVTSDGHTIWDTSFHVTGLNLGVGSAIYLTKHIRMRLEYLYTDYQAHKSHRTLNILVPPPENIRVNLDINTKIHPKVHTFMLGFDYQFDLS